MKTSSHAYETNKQLGRGGIDQFIGDGIIKCIKTSHKNSNQIWARQTRSKGSQVQDKESETPPITVLGFSQNPMLNNHSRYADDVVQTHAGSLFADSVSETPMRPP